MDISYILHHPGDKVRITIGEYKGQRGLIRTVTNEVLEIQLERGGSTHLAPNEVINFSLAARKAWTTMRADKGNEA